MNAFCVIWNMPQFVDYMCVGISHENGRACRGDGPCRAGWGCVIWKLDWQEDLILRWLSHSHQPWAEDFSSLSGCSCPLVAWVFSQTVSWLPPEGVIQDSKVEKRFGAFHNLLLNLHMVVLSKVYWLHKGVKPKGKSIGASPGGQLPRVEITVLLSSSDISFPSYSTLP